MNSSRTRVRAAWGKFNELAPGLTKGVSFGTEAKNICCLYVFRECWYTYGSETWAMNADDLDRLGRAERMMVRKMCGVSLKDRKAMSY